MASRDVLKEIAARRRERVEAAKAQLPLEELQSRIGQCAPVRSLRAAITKPKQISLIAEVKKASPSRGVICQDFDHVGIARIYEHAGVQALSVLTEEDYFQGSLQNLSDIRAAVGLPLLRKDFIIDPYQVFEARASGADCILLIAALLTKEELSSLMSCAASLGLEYLVEVHNEKELKKVLTLKNIDMIGINNRDLHTLEVDPKTTEKLFPLVPRGKTVVVESGIRSRQDVLFLKILGVHAVLIGQAFMEASDIGRKVEEIMGW